MPPKARLAPGPIPPGLLQPGGQGEEREAVADGRRLGHVPDLGDNAGVGRAQAPAAQAGAGVEQRVVDLAQRPAPNGQSLRGLSMNCKLAAPAFTEPVSLGMEPCHATVKSIHMLFVHR